MEPTKSLTHNKHVHAFSRPIFSGPCTVYVVKGVRPVPERISGFYHVYGCQTTSCDITTGRPFTEEEITRFVEVERRVA